MAIIVIEGVDGSGKTTLLECACENQKERYFVSVCASRYPPNLKTAFQYLNWVKSQRDFDLLLDRIHFLSDRVYGPILRNEDLFKDLPITFGLQETACVVYARPPDEVIIENVGRQVHLKGVNENIEKLIKGYDDMMTALALKNVKIFRYDYTIDEAIPFWRHVWGATKK